MLPHEAATVSAEQLGRIRQAVDGLNRRQLDWLSGYFSGLAETGQPAAVPVPEPPAAEADVLTILYASQTGNGKTVAEALYAEAQAKGVAAQLVSMADFKLTKLKKTSLLALITSTHGDGDAPDDAIDLHGFVNGRKAPKLEGVRYAVLALGDSSYAQFCQTGREFDEQLAKLGAERLLERVDCDVDFEAPASQWRQALLGELETLVPQVSPTEAPVAPVVAASTWNKQRPFSATVVANHPLTGHGSDRDVRHVELSLEDSGLTYQPGDALGIWPRNKPELVSDILALTELDSEQPVELGDDKLVLQQALRDKRELTLLHPGFVTGLAEYNSSPALQALSLKKDELRSYVAERQVVDVLREFPTRLEAGQLLALLRPLTPRLYSIASSQQEVEDEVHLTVAVVRFNAHGHDHSGAASGYLADELQEGDEVGVYVEPNAHFRLPEDDQTPVIMVGPGTGVAPFRAFLQEREAREAGGDNWLFFGNPHFSEDFLYQVEWQGYRDSGLLSRIDLAFSRDQADKIYVQHRLQQQGADVWRWISERDAHVYVCGDASRMAKDVQSALLAIFQQHGGLSEEAAENYLAELRRSKRYQRDVY